MRIEPDVQRSCDAGMCSRSNASPLDDRRQTSWQCKPSWRRQLLTSGSLHVTPINPSITGTHALIVGGFLAFGEAACHLKAVSTADPSRSYG